MVLRSRPEKQIDKKKIQEFYFLFARKNFQLKMATCLPPNGSKGRAQGWVLSSCTQGTRKTGWGEERTERALGVGVVVAVVIHPRAEPLPKKGDLATPRTGSHLPWKSGDWRASHGGRDERGGSVVNSQLLLSFKRTLRIWKKQNKTKNNNNNKTIPTKGRESNSN